jgi:hypothetical protein
MYAAQLAKLARITARRKAEFARLQPRPEVPASIPEPQRPLVVTRKLRSYPRRSQDYVRLSGHALPPLYDPEKKADVVVMPKTHRIGHAFQVYIKAWPNYSEPNPLQGKPDFSLEPVINPAHPVLFDANLAYGQRHIVTFTALNGYHVVQVALPAADLNLGLAESAHELRERLRNCYRRVEVQRPQIVTGSYDEETREWSMSGTDAVTSEFHEHYPVVALKLAEAREMWVMYRVTTHVWDGMADECAAVIQNAVMNWRMPTTPIRMTNWDLVKAKQSAAAAGKNTPFLGIDPTVAEQELVPVMVKRCQRLESGELDYSHSIALHHAQRNLFYFPTYLDNALKMLDDETPQYEIVDNPILEYIQIRNNRSIWTRKNTGLCFPFMSAKTTGKWTRSFPDMELSSDPQKATGQLRGAISMRSYHLRQPNADVDIARTELTKALLIYRESQRTQQLADAMPSKRQDLCERKAHQYSPGMQISAAVAITPGMEPVIYYDGSTREDALRPGVFHRTEHVALVPSRKVRQPFAAVDFSFRPLHALKGGYSLPDEVSHQEILSQFDDEWATGRQPDAAEEERLENMAFLTELNTTEFYADGVIVANAEYFTALELAREETDRTQPWKPGLAYYSDKPAIRRTFIYDCPSRPSTLDKDMSPPFIINNQQEYIAEQANHWQADKIAWLKAQAMVPAVIVRKLWVGQMVIVTPLHRFANDGSHLKVYVGKNWAHDAGSVLANGPKNPVKYKEWLWSAIKAKGNNPVYLELKRIASLLKSGKPIALVAWSEVPKTVGGTLIKGKLVGGKPVKKAARKRPQPYVSRIAAAANYLAIKG